MGRLAVEGEFRRHKRRIGQPVSRAEFTAQMAMEGDVNIVGAVQVEGEQNNLGAVQIEGDLNVLAAMQVEGALTVIGIITMDGMVVLAI